MFSINSSTGQYLVVHGTVIAGLINPTDHAPNWPYGGYPPLSRVCSGGLSGAC